MELVLVFVAALTFYGITLAPTIMWGDSVWFTLAAIGKRRITFGTAGDHPLFLILGRLFTAFPGDPARNLNIEAALFGALTVMLVYGCARQLGTSRVAAGVGAAALCVSHAFWLHAVITEVYTANAFFLLATLSLLIAWKRRRQWGYLAAALATFAVGLTNHLVLAALLPAMAIFVVATNPRPFLTRWSLVAFVGVILVIGAMAIAAPPAVTAAVKKLWIGPPSIWEYFAPTFLPGSMLREAGYYLLFLTYQFPSITLPLGVLGVWVILRDDRRVAILLLLTIAVNAGVFIHHTGWQSQASTKFVFYIGDYAVFAILCAIGTNEVLRRLAPPGTRASVVWSAVILAMAALLPPAVYGAVPAAANMYGVDLVHARTIPYRDNQTFFLNPNKHGDRGARRFGEEAFQVAKPSSVVFADFTLFAVLKYLQLVEGVRRDVLLRSTDGEERVAVHWMFDDAGHRRPTYVAVWTADYYDFSGLTGAYDLVPAGPIIEVRPRDIP